MRGSYSNSVRTLLTEILSMLSCVIQLSLIWGLYTILAGSFQVKNTSYQLLHSGFPQAQYNVLKKFCRVSKRPRQILKRPPQPLKFIAVKSWFPLVVIIRFPISNTDVGQTTCPRSMHRSTSIHTKSNAGKYEPGIIDDSAKHPPSGPTNFPTHGLTPVYEEIALGDRLIIFSSIMFNFCLIGCCEYVLSLHG